MSIDNYQCRLFFRSSSTQLSEQDFLRIVPFNGGVAILSAEVMQAFGTYAGHSRVLLDSCVEILKRCGEAPEDISQAVFNNAEQFLDSLPISDPEDAAEAWMARLTLLVLGPECSFFAWVGPDEVWRFCTQGAQRMARGHSYFNQLLEEFGDDFLDAVEPGASANLVAARCLGIGNSQFDLVLLDQFAVSGCSWALLSIDISKKLAMVSDRLTESSAEDLLGKLFSKRKGSALSFAVLVMPAGP